MKLINSIWFVFVLSFVFISCEDDGIDNYTRYSPTPLPLEIPKIFSINIIDPVIPINNPQTLEGVALGRKLFFDPILSADNSQACADCHSPANAFTDSDRFSEGIDGVTGSRNSMPLFNLAWNYDEQFFWDGRSFSLEKQAFIPVTDPIEMHSDWKINANKLQNHKEYPDLFEKAFGISKIDSTYVTKAIAQFERTLISANSRFDKHLLGELTLTAPELNGFNIFMDETKGDCFHCHGNANNPLWTDNDFHNNGLDALIIDLGLGAFTGNPADNGKFKSPSLRNLPFTAPYMHDGRFATIEEVINHYSEGLQNSTTIDPLMKSINNGGVQLSDLDKIDLKAFLLSLSDSEFINNPNFQGFN